MCMLLFHSAMNFLSKAILFLRLYKSVLYSFTVYCGFCSFVYSVYALAEYSSAEQTSAACSNHQSVCGAGRHYIFYIIIQGSGSVTQL